MAPERILMDPEAVVKPAKPKEKRRNNEKRKEKSRDAARTRRSRETEIFTDLGEALPLSKEEVDQLDKASVMRLAIAYLKVRNMVETVSLKSECIDPEEDVKPTPDALLGNETDQMLIKALDGFVLVLSEDGDINYVSENIADILGLHQIDILSQPIWDYAHQCDHEELRHLLSQKKRALSEVHGSKSCDMFLRLKCTLTSRGRSVNIKSASFKVIHLRGHVVSNEETKQKLFVAIGSPIPHPSNIEVPMGSKMFLTKHTLDMKFSYVDEKMDTLLNYPASALMGKSVFDYHHGGDSEQLSAAFKCLLSKGQMETKQYRFLGCGGGYAWIVTQATIVYDKQKPQRVVCVNYMISGIENEHEVYSLAQLEARPSVTKEASSCGSEQNQQQQQQQQQSSLKEITRKSVNSSAAGDLKVQKSSAAKSVRIVEPPKAAVSVKQTRAEANRRACAPVFVAPVPAGPALSSVAANRPRSVTDALFAAAPEVVVPAGPTPAAVAVPNQERKIPPPEEMNKGFLQFAEVEPELTMLKEEVDDLSHLAPTPGDACIPLDETTSFLASYEELNDLIDNYIYGDGFEAVISPDIPTDSISSSNSNSNSSHGSSSHQSNGTTQQHTQALQQTDSYFAEPKEMTLCSASLTQKQPLLKDAIISENVFAAAGLDLDNIIESTSAAASHEKKMDPFITYRDESSDTSVANSQLLSTDDCSMQSPDGSLPSSLCSPTESYADDDLAFMTSISMEDDMDMSMRAPYISMSEADDLPLLISDDLMWGAQPCDAPKFVQEPKLNVIVDVAHMQMVSPADLAKVVVTAPIDQHATESLDAKRRKGVAENAKTMPLAGLLLQPVVGIAEDQQQQLQGPMTNLSSSSSCSSSEDTNQSDIVETMFDDSMAKNCSTPASDMHTWSFSEFMTIDNCSVEGAQLYSTDCSPFTTNTTASSPSLETSTDSGDLSEGRKQKQRRVEAAKPHTETSHKRPLSSSNSSSGLCLKEMLAGGGSHQAKRIKCDTQSHSSSQLLQQLMAPSKVAAVQQGAKIKVAPTKKATMEVDMQHGGGKLVRQEAKKEFVAEASKKSASQPPAASNSVLMNLLVSGCDVSAGYTCLVPVRPRKTAKV